MTSTEKTLSVNRQSKGFTQKIHMYVRVMQCVSACSVCWRRGKPGPDKVMQRYRTITSCRGWFRRSYYANRRKHMPIVIQVNTISYTMCRSDSCFLYVWITQSGGTHLSSALTSPTVPNITRYTAWWQWNGFRILRNFCVYSRTAFSSFCSCGISFACTLLPFVHFCFAFELMCPSVIDTEIVFCFF